MNTRLKQFYANRADLLAAEILRLKQRNRLFVAAELTLFAVVLLLVVAYTAVAARAMLLLLAATVFGVYVFVRRMDVGNGKRIDSLSRTHAVYNKELMYLDGDFSQFADGRQYADARHEFTYDLDVFGSESLFQRINRTITSGGSDRLAQLLSTLPADAGEVKQREAAVSGLAGQERWRMAFLALGEGMHVDSVAILNVLHQVSGMRISSMVGSRLSLVLAYAAQAGFVVTILLAAFFSLDSSVPVMWGVLQLFGAMAVSARPLRSIGKAANRLHKQLQVYVMLIRHISELEAAGSRLHGLQQALFAPGSDALQSFAQLEQLLKGLDRRGNVLGLVIFNMCFLSDFFLVRRFLKWQAAYLGKIEEWVAAVSEIDALVSMAGFRYNEPEAIGADVVESKTLVYEAQGLCHPFLGAKAVRNDFTIAHRNYYIITGANMAGKSTFLRSVGINYLLAMNGMPVFASSFRVSLFRLFSSMRTSDDLAHGISYFNAELLRLKQLMESLVPEPTLIILDEILKGTNSLDKLNGSRMFLEAISRKNVSGIIATHDLELSRMADEHPARFHNYCFEISLANEITYTYKITPGVARNQNATFLLRNIIGQA